MAIPSKNIYAEKIQGNLSITSVSATSISAATYFNLPFSGTVRNSGTTTSNFIPKWTGTTDLTNSQIQDNGINISIGQSPTSIYRFWIVDNNTGTTNSFVVNGGSVSSKTAIRSESNATQYGTGVYGSAVGSVESIGLDGLTLNGTLAIGVRGIASPDEFTNITTGIGGYFASDDSYGYGLPTNRYSVQLKDGTEGANKVLISTTSDGKANWSDTLTGLTNVRSTTISATTQTISGTKGSVITSGSSTTAFLTISGSNTVGGTGYTDFIRVTNTAAGVTNPNKTIRVNNNGGIEFLNSAYNALTFSIADNGIVTINSPASVTSNSAIDNALNVGTKGQLFDDGNLHIHSSTGSVWINSLDGSAIRLGTQTNSGNSPVIVDTTTVSHSFFTKVQSGFNVAFGTEITMDNLKVRINGTGGSGGLVQAGAVSGSFDAYTTLLGNVAGSAVQGDTNSAGITFTTTYQNISSVQKTLSAGGDTTTLHLIDTTNSRIYRITAIHCQGTTGGYTSIERMV
jgi:hypothetical protein